MSATVEHITEEQLAESTLTLADVQEKVGGYIEPVKLKDGRYMLVNEDGVLTGLPLNEEATQLMTELGPYPDRIVGNVVVVPKMSVIKSA